MVAARRMRRTPLYSIRYDPVSGSPTSDPSPYRPGAGGLVSRPTGLKVVADAEYCALRGSIRVSYKLGVLGLGVRHHFRRIRRYDHLR